MSIEGNVETNETLYSLTGKVHDIPMIDKTLTKSGRSADAKVTGDEIRALNERVDNVDAHIASSVGFDNTENGLEATNLQEAVDEMKGITDQVETDMKEIENMWSDGYRMVGGEKEWLWPPMEDRTEYRTTEKFLGSPVYTMTVTHNGEVTDTTSNINYTVSIPISAPHYTRLVKAVGIYHTTDGLSHPMPYVQPYGSSYTKVLIDDVSATDIVVQYARLSGKYDSFEIQLWYI